jgi:hypothetical protein
MYTKHYKLIQAVKSISDQFPAKLPKTKAWVDPIVVNLNALDALSGDLIAAKDALKRGHEFRGQMLGMRFLDVNPRGPYALPLDPVLAQYKAAVAKVGAAAREVLTAAKSTPEIVRQVQVELEEAIQDPAIEGYQQEILKLLAEQLTAYMTNKGTSSLENLSTDPTSSSYWPSSVIASSSSVGWP